MKKNLLAFGIAIFLVTGTAYNLSAQKDKKNDKKEHPTKEDKQQGKGNSGNAQNGNKNNNGKENGPDKANGHKNGTVKQYKDNNGNNGNNGNDKNPRKNNGNDRAVANNFFNYYNWTPETFKDRKKVKDQEKVSICHKPDNNQPGVNIRVSPNAAKAHMNHGDLMGECTAVKNTVFSDIFLTKRTHYYNTIEASREELSYSQSIYDYALLRLNESRNQLAIMQANQLTKAEIERKQATVVELEENVTLLEAVIGVAADLLVSKLQ